MKHTPASLPGVLGDIARVAGVEAALTLAEARGGTQIYVPPKPDADHWLSKLVGEDAAIAIADELTCGVGPLRVDLPSGPRGFMALKRAEVDRMIAAGESERDIALATGYTSRGIRKRRARLAKRDDRQANLFDD